MIWNEDFDQKICTFWVFGGGGKEKKWSCLVVCWVLNENSTQRDLAHRTYKGKIIFSLENERKEPNSTWNNTSKIKLSTELDASFIVSPSTPLVVVKLHSQPSPPCLRSQG